MSEEESNNLPENPPTLLNAPPSQFAMPTETITDTNIVVSVTQVAIDMSGTEETAAIEDAEMKSPIPSFKEEHPTLSLSNDSEWNVELSFSCMKFSIHCKRILIFLLAAQYALLIGICIGIIQLYGLHMLTMPILAGISIYSLVIPWTAVGMLVERQKFIALFYFVSTFLHSVMRIFFRFLSCTLVLYSFVQLMSEPFSREDIKDALDICHATDFFQDLSAGMAVGAAACYLASIVFEVNVKMLKKYCGYLKCKKIENKIYFAPEQPAVFVPYNTDGKFTENINLTEMDTKSKAEEKPQITV